MKPKSLFLVFIALFLVLCIPAYAQDSTSSQGKFAHNQSDAATSGTVFLAGLQDTLSTKDDKSGKGFRLITLDPIRTAEGNVLPVGSEIRGHIDKVASAHQIGRGRLWLTFDDIKTPNGWIPIVATISDVPGVHSVRVNPAREGEIEARSSKRQDEIEAAVAGAFAGAGPGVAAHNTKGAAVGAAAGAATAFMMESGIGQDFTLEKRTKLEITLERPVYLSND